MKRADIVREARVLVEAKTRHRHRGRNIQGADCVGVLCVVAEALGVKYDDMDGYSRAPHGDRFVAHLKSQLVIARPPLRPGMVVVLRDGAHPCHCGILGEKDGKLTLIHSTVTRRQVVEEWWDGYWAQAFRCCLEFPGVED